MASGYGRGRDQRNRVHQPIQPCRDCRRRMLWVTMPSGKRNPLDLDIVPEGPEGNVLVFERRNELSGEIWRLGVVVHDSELAAEVVELGQRLYTSHFATCPAQLEKRRPRERADLA